MSLKLSRIFVLDYRKLLSLNLIYSIYNFFLGLLMLNRFYLTAFILFKIFQGV